MPLSDGSCDNRFSHGTRAHRQHLDASLAAIPGLDWSRSLTPQPSPRPCHLPPPPAQLATGPAEMEIAKLAAIFQATLDQNHHEQAEKQLEQVSIGVSLGE